MLPPFLIPFKRILCFQSKHRIKVSDKSETLLTSTSHSKVMFVYCQGLKVHIHKSHLNIEEPVLKSLSTSHVIRQISKDITKGSAKTLGIPTTTNYEIMHGNVSLCHTINCIFLLEMRL